MSIKNLDETLETILIHLSSHFRRRRLIDLKLERLSPKQRCAAMSASLDFLEEAIERQHKLNKCVGIDQTGTNAEEAPHCQEYCGQSPRTSGVDRSD